MTLITPPTTLHSLYPTACNPNYPTEHTRTIPSSALSWLLPETVSPSPTSQKYRTLASIQALSSSACSFPSSTPSPTTAKSPFFSTSGPLSPTSATSSALDLLFSQPPSASTITGAIQEMDKSHGTCFLTWIHNPANLDYISLRLRPLCLEYPLVDVANVLRWIGADWASVDCKALFRAVTQSWDQGKRRMLAFLLIRDEEMRQKAKSKMVELAQRKRSSHLGRPAQASPQQNQQQQQLYGSIGAHGSSSSSSSAPLQKTSAQVSVGSVRVPGSSLTEVQPDPIPIRGWHPSISTTTTTTTSTTTTTTTIITTTTPATTPMTVTTDAITTDATLAPAQPTLDLAALENMAAAFMITGEFPTAASLSSLPALHQTKIESHGKHRYSPYKIRQ